MLNRGLWAGIEAAVRDLAVRRGELYVVTGPAFEGQALQSIGRGGVLVPSSTWKAVHDPRTGGAGAYVCTNTATPTCDIVSVAVLTRSVGIDPFPALPAGVKATAMTLPQPQASRHASERQRGQRRDEGGSPDRMPGQQERP